MTSRRRIEVRKVYHRHFLPHSSPHRPFTMVIIGAGIAEIIDAVTPVVGEAAGGDTNAMIITLPNSSRT